MTLTVGCLAYSSLYGGAGLGPHVARLTGYACKHAFLQLCWFGWQCIVQNCTVFDISHFPSSSRLWCGMGECWGQAYAPYPVASCCNRPSVQAHIAMQGEY